MKRFPTLTACLLLALPCFTRAAEFEGSVQMSIKEGRGNAMPVTAKVKSGLLRIDIETPGGAAAIIVNNARQEMTMLLPAQNMYMVNSTARQPNQEPAPEIETTVVKTEEHEKILGYDATKYTATSKEGVTEIWVTDKLGTFVALRPPANPMGKNSRKSARADAVQEAWEKTFHGKDAFPLRVIAKNAEGKEVSRMEVTSVTKESLPASLFEPPAGYQKFDMSAMTRGGGK